MGAVSEGTRDATNRPHETPQPDDRTTQAVAP